VVALSTVWPPILREERLEEVTQKGTRMSSDSHRNDISTESSPGPDENDNLGAEDNKGEPPTVPPTGDDDVEAHDGTDAD